MLLAAASLLVLVCFVALVYNVGRLTQRRTKIQLAADAAAYSGTVVEANSLSTIAWVNSAMAQVYYDAVKYAVNENVSGVGALLAYKLDSADPKAGELLEQHLIARRQKYEALDWLLELSQIENAVALLSPRLVEEEMFAVARRMFPSQADEELLEYEDEPRGPRVSTYPSFRLFPLTEDQIRVRIEQLWDPVTQELTGWRLVDLDLGMMLELQLKDEAWWLTYSAQGLETERLIFRESKPPLDPGIKLQWEIRYEQPPNSEKQTLIVSLTDDLGWIVAGREVKGNGATDMPKLRFDKVDMDGDGVKEGTKITLTTPDGKSYSYVFANAPNGELLKWAGKDGYERFLERELEIAGVKVQLNVSNLITFPHGTVRVGEHPVVSIGPATITLRVPPTLHCGFRGIDISVRGFDVDSATISAAGVVLRPHNADGRWHQYFNAIEEFWWRHRLTELKADDDPAVKLRWQYDHQRIGAHLTYESDLERFVYKHAFGDRFGEDYDVETDWSPFIWFDPLPVARKAGPRVTARTSSGGTTPHGFPLTRIENPDPTFKFYYLIGEHPCDEQKGGCAGDGEIERTDAQGEPEFLPCPRCLGAIYPERTLTSVGATIQEFKNTVNEDRPLDGPQLQNHREFRALFRSRAGFLYRDKQEPRIADLGVARLHAGFRYPLVLTEEFFSYGLNVGVWHEADAPMVFPVEYQPDWGYVALAAARISINGASPRTAAERLEWCERSRDNLYSPNVVPKLASSRTQVLQEDLDFDIIVGESLVAMSEQDSPASYLWDVLLNASDRQYNNNVWLDRYEGKSDRRVGDRLRNMRVKMRGREHRFDVQNPALDEAVKH